MDGVDSAADVVVAGGGPVGALLALALADAGVETLLVEPRDGASPYDERPIALSLASRVILGGVGAWDGLDHAATPMTRIHVSQAGHFGGTRLSASRCRVPAFGYVVSAGLLDERLRAAIADRPGLDVVRGEEVTEVVADDRAAVVRVGDRPGRSIDATLVAVADGGRSALGQRLGIDYRERDYGQVALAFTVTAESEHRNVAFERFTPDGPIALLPMTGRRFGVVWTCAVDRGNRLAALDDRRFLAELDAETSNVAGRFESVGARTVHALRFASADRLTAPRTALVGNAANRLHPVAGQGLNLGFRDAAHLADIVAAARREGLDAGGADCLDRFEAVRRSDHRRVVGFTNGLVDLFGLGVAPAALVRGLGLVLLGLGGALNRGFARHAMGYGAPVPRLARGLRP